MKLFDYLLMRTPRKFHRHTCETDRPVQVVPIAPNAIVGGSARTAVLYRCDVCHVFWEVKFEGSYTLQDFMK